MRRAGRIIYNGAMALSLLLCLACTGVWVRSYSVSDRLEWYDGPVDRSCFDVRSVWSSRGGVQLSAWHATAMRYGWWADEHFQHLREHGSTYPFEPDSYYVRLTPSQGRHCLLGFQLALDAKAEFRGKPYWGFVVNSLTLPLYFPTLLFALLPAHYVLRVRRRRRIAKRLARGCCPACGYDLRASTGRCPECGFCGAGVPPASSAAGTAAPQQQP